MYRGTLDEVSNKATLMMDIEVIDDDTGELADLTGATIVVEFRAKRSVDDYDSTIATAILSASTGNGKITIPSTGVFRLLFTLAEMTSLCAQTVDAGVTITRDGFTDPLFIGLIPIIDGVVT